LGYRGEAQFVSFQWTPYGDETHDSDGRVQATGNWQVFLAFIHHPAVSPLLSDYDLGSSDSEAKHVLILDQKQLTLYIAPVKEAEKFLSEQWPKEPPIRMSQEEYAVLVTKALKNLRPPKKVSVDEIQWRIEQQYALVEELQ
jgi:hypothetical protein